MFIVSEDHPFVCYYTMVLISEIGSTGRFMRWIDNVVCVARISHIGGSNKTMWLSRLLFRQNNVDLNYMKRVGLMMLTLRDGLEMPASLGSLTIHFRHMTENVCERERERRRAQEKPFGRDRTGSSFACHVTCRSVITRVIDRSRLDWPMWWFARPEKYCFWQLKRQIDKDDIFRDGALTLSELFSYMY